MEKIVYLIILIFLISCGNPVDSDKNIVKEKIDEEGIYARPTSINNEWNYKVNAEYFLSGFDNLPTNYPTNISEKLISKNQIKGNNWFISKINDNEVNVEVGEDYMYYEIDEFEKLVLTVTKYTDLYINFIAETDWTYNGINYKYLGKSNISINSNLYDVKIVEFENQQISKTGAIYSKKVFYNKEFGIIRIEYIYNFPTRQTTFNLKLDLVNFNK